jgi:fructose-bisphosphate aldolase, class II
MNNLIQAIRQAERDQVALGHFNVSDVVLLKAVVGAAQELNVPVIVGASEGEREFLGTKQIAALVKSLRDEMGVPVFLNADHTHSLAKALEAAKAGFDSVVFDRSALTFERNVKETREAVEGLKFINPNILVEGEIGDIGTGSEIHDDIAGPPRPLSTASEARQFVEATRVDILAPAVGNTHGMVRKMLSGAEKKHLDVARIREIKMAAAVPLTLHGASGTADDDLKLAIGAGINIVHINTELRVAWRRGLEQGLATRPDEVVPYRILPVAVQAVQEVVRSRLLLFNAARFQERISAAGN